jgi:hypothetical protein
MKPVSGMTNKKNVYGYRASAQQLIDADETDVLVQLERHHRSLSPGNAPSGQARESWKLTFRLLRDALNEAIASHEGARNWQAIFEYTLPFEGGRRPDVVVLAGSVVVVVEFKDSPALSSAHVDQVRAYGRDLREYHSVAQNLVVEPVLLYPIEVRVVRPPDDVHVIGPSRFGDLLMSLARGEQASQNEFIAGT